ncbi:PREDICTED: para-nitrobenzyl esterase-like [Habropoda laboriosa]|uniref:para-nitrobenzyl esterase-like n=1 Tax=Habropoda laboriosa TaxID=597456 RepID=UPI00083D6019|nr:PREDICTED: para-nitrobenzyl esterase-like [Habropoda laboriosa]
MDRTTLFLFLLFLIARVNGQDGPIVQTLNGLVRGTYNTTIWKSMPFSSFRGIPYGKPPVGELRFQPPVPVDPWGGILEATSTPNPCPQFEDMSQILMGREDCLYLNVYTPVTNFTGPLKLIPVMVWIYGGGFTTGHSNDTLYGPRLMIERDVVIVTFNYRVGPLGFLSLNDPKALGNAGLKDQYLVLQWVNKNIAAFGGDPNQVTIFGESAGSVSVGYHVLSEKAAGLFSKAFLMSGTPMCEWSIQTAEDNLISAQQLALLLGYAALTTEDLLDFLLQVPALDLATATANLSMTHPLPFRPVIEDPALDYYNTAYITECSVMKYHTGRFNKVPTMMGYMHDEVIFFLYIFLRSATPIQDAIAYLEKMDKSASNVFPTLVNVTDEVALEVYKKVGTDLFFISPIDLTQKMLAANNSGNPIFFYRQSYEAPYSWHKDYLRIPFSGAAHFDDIPYIWETNAIPVPTDLNDPYYQFLQAMVDMTTNFAKYGNPTPEGNSPIGITWTPSGEEGLQINLNTLYTGAQSSNVEDLLDYLSKIDPFTAETAKSNIRTLKILDILYFHNYSTLTLSLNIFASDYRTGGVAHFDDIPLLYDMVHLPTPTDPNDPDYQTRYKMATMFANFAKYADPTPASNNPINIAWTQSGVDGYQIDLNVTCTMNNR